MRRLRVRLEVKVMWLITTRRNPRWVQFPHPLPFKDSTTANQIKDRNDTTVFLAVQDVKDELSTSLVFDFNCVVRGMVTQSAVNRPLRHAGSNPAHTAIFDTYSNLLIAFGRKTTCVEFLPV